jgi:hypothetical protein
MKFYNRITLLVFCVFSLLVFASCEEEGCPNYDLEEGGMSLNGDLLLPAKGTSVITSSVFEGKVVTWFGRGVAENCESNTTVTLVVTLEENDSIIGSFNFVDDEMGGQISYSLDENGENGQTLNLIEGTLVVETEGEGVLTLDFDGFDSDGDFVDYEVRYKFL